MRKFNWEGILFEGLFVSRKPTFALDIGFNTLKVVEIKKRGNRYRLRGLNTVEVPPGCVTKDGLREPEKIVQALQKALVEAKPRHIDAKCVITALPESLVFTKILTLPRIKEADLAKTIPFEAAEIFPVPVNDLYLDWQILSQGTAQVSNVKNQEKIVQTQKTDSKTAPQQSQPVSGTLGTIDVLIIGAPKKIVDSFHVALAKFGFELLILETKPIAMARALVSPRETSGILLLDIGAESSSMTIVDGGILRFTGTVAAGGNALIRALSEGCKTNEVDTLQRLQTGQLGVDETQIKQYIAPAVSPIIDEIDHAIRFYHNRIQAEGRINFIRIAGGGANIPGIAANIQEKTGRHAEIANPLLNISNPPSQITPQFTLSYAAAIGCALRNYME